MKRILTTILISCMIFSIAPHAQASITNQQCTELINSMTNVESSSFKGDEKMLRSEFATLIIKLLGLSAYGDVTDMETLYSIKAIGKDSNGSLRENDSINYNEAIFTLLTIAGYGEIAELSGGYPVGYNKIAVTNGLVCSVNGFQSLTQSEVYLLIYKMLNMASVDASYGKNTGFSIQSNKTVMSEIFEIDEKSGILSACGGINIYSNAQYSEDIICIGTKTYRNKFRDCSEYIGQNVTVFYKIDNGEETAIFIYPKQSNGITVINDAFDMEYSQRTYKWYEDKKLSKIKISDEAVFIYNGHLPDNNNSMKFVPNNGWVELVDNNADNKADVVKIYNYTNYFITGTQSVKDGMIIYSNDNPGVLVTQGQTKNNTKLFDYDATAVKLKRLSEGILVSVFSYMENGVNKADTVYLSSNDVVGYVSGFDKENNKIELDGVDYTYDCLIKSEISLISLGTYRTFTADYKGKLAYIKGETEDDKNKGVAYLIKTAEKSNLSKVMEFKLYDVNGELRTVESDDRLYVDGVLEKGSQNISNAINNAMNTLNRSSFTVAPIIAYTMFDNGKLRSIDFPSDKLYTNTDTLPPLNHMLFAGGGTQDERFRLRANVFGSDMICNTAVKVILVPEDKTDGDSFRVSSNLSEVFRDDGTYNVQTFCYNNSDIGVDYVVYSPAKDFLEPTTPISVVKKITYQKNKDGDFVPALQILSADGGGTYFCSDDSVLENAVSFTDNSIHCEVEQGDIIKIGLNINDEIVTIKMINDASDVINGFKPSDSDFGDAKYFAGYHIIRGTVFDKNEDIAIVAKQGLALTMDNAANSDFEAYRLSLFKIIKVYTDGTIKLVDSSEIKAYKRNNGEYSNVIAGLRNGVPSVMVIYE